MEIRYASGEDTQAIINLLKTSLGESLMPKSVEFWNWKHLDNPFGESPVLLTIDSNQIVGVRAFMRWRWAFGNQIYQCVRAVDTATHPEYQGKGIFRKLTLSLVDMCKEKGLDFVFNTPNAKSKPGYLKMGWLEAGKLPIALAIQRPFSVARNLVFRHSNPEPATTLAIEHVLNHRGLKHLIDTTRPANVISTDWSVDYLRWRYQKIPVASYFAMIDEEGGNLNALLIGRVKDTRLGRECRITDYFSVRKGTSQLLKSELRKKKREWGIDFTTISATSTLMDKGILGTLCGRAKAGPMVTVRSLELQDLSNLHRFANWSPSLGDLEVF